MPAQVLMDRFLRNEISHQYKLSAYEKLILFFLASYMGSKLECYPSYKSLAIDCSLSIDSVKRGVKSLEAKCLIYVSRIKGKNNRYTFNLCNINLGANSTECSQHLDAISTNYQVPPAPRVGADSTPNNIINNIRESTSLISSKKHHSKKTKTKTNKTNFPEEMEIGDSHRAIANQFGLDVKAEHIHFREYHLSKGSKFSRWDMAFNTWLRNAAKFSKKKSNQTTDIMSGVFHE